MSDFEILPFGRFGRIFLVEPEKGSTPDSTVFTGGLLMGSALLLLSSLLRLMADQCIRGGRGGVNMREMGGGGGGGEKGIIATRNG